MGQTEVYEFLKKERELGNEQFFSVKEIKNRLKEQGMSNGVIEKLNEDLARLNLHDYLDMKIGGKLSDWNRMFRIKSRYLNTTKYKNTSIKDKVSEV